MWSKFMLQILRDPRFETQSDVPDGVFRITLTPVMMFDYVFRSFSNYNKVPIALISIAIICYSNLL